MRALLWSAAIGCLAGCARESAPPARVERDSAGIAIIEWAGSAADALPELRFEAAPLLAIGDDDGEAALHRVSGAARLSDGRIVLANAGTAELRWYGRDGTVQASAGRQGAGPGEFEQPRLAGALPGDSVVVWDYSLRRVSVFGPDATFARSFEISGDVGLAPDAEGLLADGRIVLLDRTLLSSGVQTGVARDSVLLTVAGEGTVDTLGRFGSREVYNRRHEGASTQARLPFGRAVAVAVGGDLVWAGPNEAMLELRAWDANGALRRIVRITGARRPVTDQDVRAMREAWLADTRTDYRADAERLLDEMPVPRSMAPHDAIEADAAGRVWVQRPQSPLDVERSWLILEPDGVPAARARTPRDADVLAVGDDWLLGHVRDEMGIERVRLYRRLTSNETGI